MDIVNNGKSSKISHEKLDAIKEMLDKTQLGDFLDEIIVLGSLLDYKLSYTYESYYSYTSFRIYLEKEEINMKMITMHFSKLHRVSKVEIRDKLLQKYFTANSDADHPRAFFRFLNWL